MREWARLRSATYTAPSATSRTAPTSTTRAAVRRTGPMIARRRDAPAGAPSPLGSRRHSPPSDLPVDDVPVLVDRDDAPLDAPEDREADPDDRPEAHRDEREEQVEEMVDPVAGRYCRLEVTSRFDPPALSAPVGERPVENRFPLVGRLVRPPSWAPGVGGSPHASRSSLPGGPAVGAPTTRAGTSLTAAS